MASLGFYCAVKIKGFLNQVWGNALLNSNCFACFNKRLIIINHVYMKKKISPSFVRNGGMLVGQERDLVQGHDGLNREYYRINYSPSEGPILKVGDAYLTVFNLSEGGACVSSSEYFTLVDPQPVPVRLSLGDDWTFLTDAICVWQGAERAGIRFVKPLPQTYIYREQLRMRNLYYHTEQPKE